MEGSTGEKPAGTGHAENASALPWYVVQTQPNREHLAEVNLARYCERVFCPRFKKRTILHGYRREVVRPLFPGYVFAAFDVARRFRAVHYARGAHGIVVIGGEPGRVPVDLIEAIEARLQGGYVRLEPRPLHAGERVEITAGPFRGHIGIFDGRLSGQERVSILLETLNARAIVGREAVRALG